jgi:hypothetical protein
MMHGHDPAKSTAVNYREFAQDARGRSPAYESLASAVADDPAVLEFIGSLPPEKRQPNLLFAAARYLLASPAGLGGPGDLGGAGDFGGPGDFGRLRDLIRRDRAGLAAVMLARPARPAGCASR